MGEIGAGRKQKGLGRPVGVSGRRPRPSVRAWVCSSSPGWWERARGIRVGGREADGECGSYVFDKLNRGYPLEAVDEEVNLDELGRDALRCPGARLAHGGRPREEPFHHRLHFLAEELVPGQRPLILAQRALEPIPLGPRRVGGANHGACLRPSLARRGARPNKASSQSKVCRPFPPLSLTLRLQGSILALSWQARPFRMRRPLSPTRSRPGRWQETRKNAIESAK